MIQDRASQMQQPDAQPLSLPRNVERCPTCGYWLTGLPDEGRCPECGQGYDQTMVILNAFGRGEQFTAATSRASAAAYQTFAPGIVISAILWIGQRDASRLLAILPVLASCVAWFATRPRPDDLPPVQLALGPDGWAYDLHPAATPRTRLHAVCHLAIYAPLVLIWLRDARFVVISCLAGILFLTLIDALRKRFQKTKVRHLAEQARELTPWTHTSVLEVSRVRTGTWLITVAPDGQRKARSFRLLNPLHAEQFCFEVELSNDRMAHLLAQAKTWPTRLIGSGVSDLTPQH